MPIMRIRGEDGKFYPVPSTVGPAGKDGAPGKDGGYYKPSVSESGDLTWTASKSDMPAVSGANIKGPQGNAGADGADGKTAYQAAKEGGYTGTETEFNAALGGMKNAPFLPLSGGTITGGLQVNYIAGIDGGKFDTGGINVTGSFTTDGDVTVDLKGCVINGVNDPVKETDAANKGYVDDLVGNINTVLDTINGEVV